MDNCHNNRMNSHNLAVIFGPTLMGTDPSTAIADAGWQINPTAPIDATATPDRKALM